MKDLQDLTDPRMNEVVWRALDLLRAYAARDRTAIVGHLAPGGRPACSPTDETCAGSASAQSEPVQAVRGALGAEEGVSEGGRARAVGPDVSGTHERARGGAAEVDRAQVAHVQGQVGSRSVGTQSALLSLTVSR